MSKFRWRDVDRYNAQIFVGRPLEAEEAGYTDRHRTLRFDRQESLGANRRIELEEEEDFRADVLALLTRIADTNDAILEQMRKKETE